MAEFEFLFFGVGSAYIVRFYSGLGMAVILVS